jgi:RNA polymerase sigma factor (sigma-70 family)
VDDWRLREFIDHEYARVVRAVALVGRNAHDAAEAVDDALARAWEHEARRGPIDNLAAWVTTVAMNRTRSTLRHRKMQQRVLPRLVAGGTAADPTGNEADAMTVRAALAELPRREREVTVLRYYLGLDVHAIAQQLGLADGTVKALLFRARGRLAIALGETFPTTDTEARHG